jgi:hypothetical protein
MAVITPAIGVQSGSHSAKAFRQIIAAIAGHDPATFVNGVTATGPAHGLCTPTALAVTQRGTPNMSVDVAKGTALITGSSSLAQGCYAFTNDATVNLPIATADATNPRRDIVIAQVRDNTEDSTGFNDARLFVVTGTPAASPVDPAIPANCLALARVAVAAGASSIVNANITSLASLLGALGQVRRTGVGTATQTTDAGGSVTVTHGLGWTPSVVIIEPSAPNGGTTATRFVSHSVGTIGSTTFVVQRCVSQDGSLLASTSVTFRWVAFE